MLIEMKSPAFRKQGEERPPIHFKEGLNVVLGKEDGAMSIGKSSSLLDDMFTKLIFSKVFSEV